MAHLYFTRHGQTTWNVRNKICGATDVELTPLGKKQAEILGLMLLDEGYKIDEILYSPLTRAADTATIISVITGIPARAEMRLKEQCFGRYEGTPRNGADFHRAKMQFINSYDGGESMLRAGQRIYNLLDELKYDEKVYLLVAHNGIARFVKSYFEDMTNEEFGKNGIRNCEIQRFEFDSLYRNSKSRQSIFRK